MTDWHQAARELDAAAEADVDDLIDDLASRLLGSPPDSTAVPVAVKALGLARSDLSVSSMASALVYVASDDDEEAIEPLERVFEVQRQHPFLAPSLLGSLTLLALRNDSARVSTVRYLLRLKPEDPRPLLVRGIKSIGLLCDRENDPKLRTKLSSLLNSEDLGVRAEAQQQGALMRLADAFLQEGHAALITSLQAAREAFRLGEFSEEIRPDATMFRLLLDAVLQFEELDRNRAAAAQQIKRLAAELQDMNGQGAEDLWMDRSPAADRIARQCVLVASSMGVASLEVSNVSRWTNFDKAVVRLATCYSDIRNHDLAHFGYAQTGQALRGLADRVMKPKLGPVLARKVGWESFEEVVRCYEADGGLADVLSGARELQQCALKAERSGANDLPDNCVRTLRAMADKAGCTPEELIQRFKLQIEVSDGGGLTVATAIQLASPGMRRKSMPLPAIGIIVALSEEFDAVRVMIENEQRYRAPGSGGGREYMLGDIPSVRGGIHQVVLAQTMDMGNTSAASRTSKMLADFDGLDHIIMCGIAGGVPHPEEPQEHVRLGDIVVSNRKGVIQYDFGKQGEVFEERFAPRPPSASLLEAVHMLQSDLLAGERPWDAHIQNGLRKRDLTPPDAATDVIVDDKGEPVDHPVIKEARPRIFLGPIASANVVQGDFRKRDLLRDMHKVKAIEMEGFGVADAAWEHEKAGYLVVRGICDYCDIRTKARQTDSWKRYAAMVAAAYVRALIEAMPGTRSQGVHGAAAGS